MKTKYSVCIVNSCNIVLDITTFHINYKLMNYIVIRFSAQTSVSFDKHQFEGTKCAANYSEPPLQFIS